MPKLGQVAFTSGEISPELHSRVDLARFTSALKTCRNFFVRASGGVSNRAGTQFIYQLDPASNATLLPFIRSETDAYMLVLQEENAKVFRDGSFVDTGATRIITNITNTTVAGHYVSSTATTSVAHGFSAGATVTIADVVSTGLGTYNGSYTILSVGANTFTFDQGVGFLNYSSGGTATASALMVTLYQSDELTALRFTQSADVMTLTHQGYFPSEITRTGVTSFTFSEITDIETGPFLDLNDSAITVTASAASGTGITLTASSSIFNANHVGALFKIQMQDLSALLPWEPTKILATSGNSPDGILRYSNGKVYECATTTSAPASGIYTGTIPPSHDEGTEADGDGTQDNNLISGVLWTYIHSQSGIVRITAQAGTTATADVLEYVPVVSPATTTKWAFGAWSEDQGYPAVCTYFQDRLVFANTLERPQDQYASKTGDYHNFSGSIPVADDDAITQTLNSRRTNAIAELVPLEQLVSLTAKESWASPQRGESWSPATVGFYLQSSVGSANLRSIQTGDGAIYAERFGTRLRELKYGYDRDKFGGQELTVLARHLFEEGTIVDMDYAEYPDGILWIVRSDGVLIGMTYLPEQEVIAFSRHDTDGYFERVCVIPEEGRDAVYFVVRRTVNGSTARYLERLANRSNDSLDAFYVDCGLSYDGRNTTATTITATGASYDGGATVTLTATASIFASTDIDDAIQFGAVHCIITGYTNATTVTAQLQSPLPAALQATATTTWTFARNTFSNLGHLEGEIVTGLADGNAIDPDDTTTAGVVTGGDIVLNYPAGVVHIGKGITAEIETLTMNIPGGSQIRDNAKIVPKVSVVVKDTAGLKVGPDADNLEEISTRDYEFYTDPNELQTGVQKGYIVNTWDDDSSILIRQDYPKPATILAVIPTVQVGSNG